MCGGIVCSPVLICVCAYWFVLMWYVFLNSHGWFFMIKLGAHAPLCGMPVESFDVLPSVPYATGNKAAYGCLILVTRCAVFRVVGDAGTCRRSESNGFGSTQICVQMYRNGYWTAAFRCPRRHLGELRF